MLMELSLMISRCAQLPQRPVLSRSDVLFVASSIIKTHPTIACLFGSYARGTARPDIDIDIALFIPCLCWDERADVDRVHTDLERI